MKYSDILISVVVVAYNAEDYIEKALNSIKNQTYKNIELIITDDCSKDRTYELCKAWIQKNKNRFISTKLVHTKQNSGVVVNLNNGCKLVTGDWVKILSGDDLLPEDCLELYMKYVIENNIDMICCSRSISFVEQNGDIRFVDSKPDPYTKKVFSMSSHMQYKKMLMEYVILLPTTAFIAKKLYETVGLYDEEFPEIEDQPFFLKIAKNGIKIEYCDDIIGYLHRTEIDSISQTTTGLMNIAAFKVNGKLHKQDKKFVLPNVPKYHLIFYYHYYLDLLRRYIVIDVMNNKDTLVNRVINKVFLALDPIFMKKKIYNIVNNNEVTNYK